MGQYRRKLKKGVRWFYSGQYLGQKYHSKAIYLSKSECAKAEREKLQELDETARNPRDMKLKTLMDYRLDELKAKRSKDYYLENKRYFKKALKAWGNINVSQVTKQMVSSLSLSEHTRLKQVDADNWKVNSMLRCLKALFNYGINVHELRISNPCKIEFYPVTISLKYIPTDNELEAVKKKNTSDQNFIFDFVDQTGCRISEAVRLKWSDVEGALVTLFTRKAKNSNLTPRRIPRPDCLKGKDGKGKVFKTWNAKPRFLEERVKKLGHNRWNWHNLRHRRASIWASEGMTVFEIMHRLGHNNMSTTMKYLQLLGFSSLKNG